VSCEVVTLITKKFTVCRVEEIVKMKAGNSPTEVCSFPSDYSESFLGRLQCLEEVYVVQSRVQNLDAQLQHLDYWNTGNLEDELGVGTCRIYVSVICCVT
jgi:hypothetical protein